MQQFNYPTTLLFGEGSLAALAERMRGLGRALLVTDAGVVKAGLVREVEAALGNTGVSIAVFDGVHPNPIEEDVEKGLETYRRQGCEALVALGGGSPMDAARSLGPMNTASTPGVLMMSSARFTASMCSIMTMTAISRLAASV